MDRPHSLHLQLASEPSASATVRRTLDGLGLPPDLHEPARLMASELVSNSVRHVGAGPSAPIAVSVDVGDDRLRVTVNDVGHGEVRLRSRETRDAGSGYGLFLVDTMADRWGTAERRDGTSVWFELDIRRAC